MSITGKSIFDADWTPDWAVKQRAEQLEANKQLQSLSQEEIKNRWKHINIFPEALIELNIETARHDELLLRLSNHPADQWEVKLAEIANYCEVILGGDYLPEEIEKLCVILTTRLVTIRKAKLVNTSDGMGKSIVYGVRQV